MKKEIAKIIYNFQMGCSRKEAIMNLGCNEKDYPIWEDYIDQSKFLLIAEKVIKRKNNLNKEQLAKLIFEELNPKSSHIWAVNYPFDQIIFQEEIANICVPEWERDDYREIAIQIFDYLKSL